MSDSRFQPPTLEEITELYKTIRERRLARRTTNIDAALASYGFGLSTKSERQRLAIATVLARLIEGDDFDS